MRRARLALAALTLATGLAAPAQAQPPPERTDVQVDVRGLSGFLTPESPKLVVRARAVNTTGEPVRNLVAGLRFGSPVRGRSAIAAGGSPARYGTQVGYRDIPPGELAPGGTTEVEFDVPLAQVPFARSPVNGVYPLRIEVRSRYEVVGAMDTYVVWWPSTAQRLRVAMLWPLAEPSHRLLGNDFADDDLAASVEDGRLDALLRLGDASPMPLTWAVDPELLDALRRMAGTYTVNGVEGTRGAVARAWLDRARSAVAGATVIPLPYGDPDLSATAAGALVVDAFRIGREVLRRDLGVDGTTTLAWPPGPTLSGPAEGVLAAQGVRGVVLPDSALPLSGVINYTPTAATPLNPGGLSTMTALVADGQLNRWVGEPTGAEGPRVAVQRFLADSAMAAMERPSSVRDVVVAPPRTWEPVSPFAATLLTQTVKAPWLEPVGLGAVLAGQPSTEPRTRAPADRGLLDPAHVNRVLAERRRLNRLRGILTDPQRAPEQLTELDDALLRSVSSHWAARPGEGARLVDAVAGGISGQLGRLRLLEGSQVTMTGRTGSVPLTFQNDLGQAVRVRLRISSNDRLDLEGRAGYDRRNGAEVTIQPGTTTLEVTGKATTGGLFTLRVEVLAYDGAPLGITTSVRVRSTAYGAVALTLTGVAFGLLLIASATRLIRRRRRPPPAAPALPDPEPATV